MTHSAGPTWTRGRLAATLGECYGRTPAGAVDVAAVAKGFGRAQSTVRKWLRGTDEKPSAMPASRLRELTTGGRRVEREAVGKADYAREAIARIALPRDRGINPNGASRNGSNLTSCCSSRSTTDRGGS